MSSYIHGYGAEEQARLTAMQRILNGVELAALEGILDLGEVRRLLDVGAGLGQLTRAFRRAIAADGVVVGIERDPRQLEEARRQAEAAGEEERGARLEMRRGSADALPLDEHESGSFDLVHARFLLEHVPNPEACVAEMLRAARAGGLIVLVDDDHELLRFQPQLDPVAELWEIYWRSYRHGGCDPLVGRRLPELLVGAGAELQTVTAIFYGACRGMELFDPVVDNLREVLRGALPALLERGAVSDAASREALAALERWREDPAATVWYSLPLAIGRRPKA